jgi:hypothetical protein
MDRPTALLLVLAAIGLGCAGLLWGAKSNKGVARIYEEKIEVLQREHALEMRRLRDKEAPPTADGSTTEGDAGLLEKIDSLQARLNLYEDENERLLKEIDQLVASGATLPGHQKSAGAPDAARKEFSEEEEKIRASLQAMVSGIRELEFKQPPLYAFTDWDGMKEEMAATQAAEGTARSRAFAAMGFVPPGTDVNGQVLNLEVNQLGAANYAGESKIRFNGFGSLKSIHDRTAVAVELTRLLQDQHFGFFGPRIDFPNNDARNAARALSIGDGEIVKVRFMLQDEFPSSDELTASPTAMSKEDFQAAAPFLREDFLFPFTVGMSFCQALHDKDAWNALNAAYRRLPATTAEILHPELYRAEAPITPVDFGLSKDAPDVLGAWPLWDDSAGELGVAVFLNMADYSREMENMGIDAQGMMPVLAVQDFTEKPGGRAAAGWRGDRYFVYPNGEGTDGGDHTVWLTAWAGEEDALEFFRAFRDALRLRYQVPLPDDDAAEADGSAREFVLDSPRHLRLWITGKEVRLVNAGNAQWRKALQQAFP